MRDADAPVDLARRRIKSFVLRQGRITGAQAQAFATLWGRYGIDYAGTVRDFAQEFGREAPLVLEIGFGNGEQLRHAAASETGRNHIGIEVHRPGVGRLLNALAADGLENVRLYAHDAVEVLGAEIADGALAELRIYFPDPWPKSRHHKRRLVQPEFVALAARKLASGARLHLATDWQEYAAQMLGVLDASPALRNCSGAGRFAARPPWRIRTHFENRGVRLGHEVFDLIYRKSGTDALSPDMQRL